MAIIGSSLTKSMYDKDSITLSEVLDFLNRRIGHNRWYIAGSYANPKIISPNDIDIFFYHERDYEQARTTFHNYLNSKSAMYSTHNADSMYMEAICMPIQLIRRHFGPPSKVFQTFDLNVCKWAILPNGTRKVDPTARNGLTIERINCGTFSRYFKYVGRLNLADKIPELGKELIDTYMADDTLIEEYYQETTTKIPVNKALFDNVRNFHTLEDYALEQAAIHAPELLI